MTELHEVAFAVSLTNLREWGTDVQVLLALSAEPTMGETKLCHRELAKRTGLSTGTVSVALKRLDFAASLLAAFAHLPQPRIPNSGAAA